MAAAHSGYLAMRCSLCEVDATAKEAWGCEQPTEEPVWEDGGDVYYSCPLLFIPPEAVEWYKEYDYCVHVRGIEYQDLPWTWLEAYSTYRAAMTNYEHRRESERSQKSGSMMAFRNSKLRGSDDG